MGSNLSSLGTRFALLKELKEHHERMAKILGGELSDLGEQLFRSFADDGQASFRLLGERTFTDNRDRIISPVVKYRPTIIAQAQFYQLLRTTGQGSLIKETIHPGTLEKWVTEIKRNNKPMPPEEMLKVFQVETATVRRAPSSASSKETTSIEGEETHE